MQNAAGDGGELEADGQNDSYQLVVSDLSSLIAHVQASLRRIEQAMVREMSPGSQETAANLIVLDDVSPRYVKVSAALRACDANLGIALHSLLDFRTPKRGTSAYAKTSLALPIVRM